MTGDAPVIPGPWCARVRVAALYIDERGPYPSMDDVDAWGETRDATRYVGPWPIVAHPPCGSWATLRRFAHGLDKHLAPLAVAQVRRWGGVLEHPAHSKLFDDDALGLPHPGELPDAFGGFTVEVNQVDFGHVARKRTWIYCVGIPRAAPTLPLIHRTPTHWIAAGKKRRPGHTPAPATMKHCSSQQRRRTPIVFARWLVELAALAQAPCSSYAIENLERLCASLGVKP